MKADVCELSFYIYTKKERSREEPDIKNRSSVSLD